MHASQHLPALAFDGAFHEDPIQGANNDVRPNAAVAKSAAKASLAQPGDQGRVKALGVESPAMMTGVADGYCCASSRTSSSWSRRKRSSPRLSRWRL
jgi:hypothetical protein